MNAEPSQLWGDKALAGLDPLRGGTLMALSLLAVEHEKRLLDLLQCDVHDLAEEDAKLVVALVAFVLDDTELTERVACWIRDRIGLLAAMN